MKTENHPGEISIGQILDKLRDLETRITSLEQNASFHYPRVHENEPEVRRYESLEDGQEDDGLESQVGKYGMAWLGNFVLLFGILFMVQFLESKDMTLFSTLFGFVSVAVVYMAGYLTRTSYPYLSKLFVYNGHITLFVVTLKMHFSQPDPLIESRIAGLILVMFVIVPLLIRAYMKSKQVLAWLVIVMLTITAIASNSTLFMLSLMMIVAIYTVLLVRKNGWWALLVFSIFFVYTTFLLWYFNNPFVTHTPEGISDMHGGLLFLLGTAFTYTLLTLLPESDKITQGQLNTSIVFNGLGFSFILALVITGFFSSNFYLPLGIISVVALTFSAILQYRGTWKISAALYALYGFVVLSITIAGIYKFPVAFLLLSVQSLLVVSMALWFRSRFIVVMNTGLFLALLVTYFIFSEPVSKINFSFTLVAFVTARIINWKKDRLEIKTELIRNTYLITGFFMALYSLFHAFSGAYITISWTLAAALFFVLSIVLNNVKYRWLAITTMIVTAFYFFLFNLKNIGIGYRVIALMLIAVLSLTFSIYYSKRMKIKSKAMEDKPVTGID